MSLLRDRDIRDAIEDGRIGIDPYDIDAVQPASYDLRLDDEFVVFDNHSRGVIDPAVNMERLTRKVRASDFAEFTLHPGEFMLAATQEVVSLSPSIAAQVNGKSSLGRLGLLVHSTAGFIDPGFTGVITLELSNVATLPMRLYAGMKIGQVCFFDLGGDADVPYGDAQIGSHYQGQRGPTPSRSWQKFDLKRTR